MKRVKISELQVGDRVDFATLPGMEKYTYAFGVVEDVGPGQKMVELPFGNPLTGGTSAFVDDPDDPGPYIEFEHWGQYPDFAHLPDDKRPAAPSEVDVLDDEDVEKKIAALGEVLDRGLEDDGWTDRKLGYKQQITWCHEYGEPGYDDPSRGILFGDWNHVSKEVQGWLGELGYELEWSDEWTIGDNNKAYRTSPDSYSWTPSHVTDMEGNEYMIDDHDGIIEAFAMTDEGHPPHLLPDWVTDSELRDEGFEKVEGDDRESGFFPGQTDTPEQDAKPLFDKGAMAVVFRRTEQSQFYGKWDVWVKWPLPYEIVEFRDKDSDAFSHWSVIQGDDLCTCVMHERYLEAWRELRELTKNEPNAQLL